MPCTESTEYPYACTQKWVQRRYYAIIQHARREVTAHGASRTMFSGGVDAFASRILGGHADRRRGSELPGHWDWTGALPGSGGLLFDGNTLAANETTTLCRFSRYRPRSVPHPGNTMSVYGIVPKSIAATAAHRTFAGTGAHEETLRHPSPRARGAE